MYYNTYNIKFPDHMMLKLKVNMVQDQILYP